MALSSPGIGSNLDVNSIVSQLMAVERRPLAQLDRREAAFQAQLTAFGSLKGAVAAFQNAMLGLRDAGRFESFTAQSGNPAVVAAKAATTAAAGNYSVNVAALAVPQVLQAQGVANPTAAGSTGTVTLQVGSGPLHSITVDGTNNTLSGLRDAINTAQDDVEASIVNDGSATPHRLLLTAARGGTANTITLSHTLSVGVLKDALDGVTEAQAAVNASVSVNGVFISGATNQLADAIPGVMLTLNATGSSRITISRDTAQAQTTVQGFVKAYNDLSSTVSTLTAYNAATGRGGALVGNSAAISVQTQLRAAAGSALAGVSGDLSRLSQIGVEFDRNGRLTLDATKLDAAIASRPNDIASLFALRGRSSADLVKFVSSGAASQPGAYAVHITAPATRASALAANSAASTTVIDGSNDSLSLSLDGTASSTLSIPHGSYTPAQLAATLQNTLNAAAPLAGANARVIVSLDGGRLRIASERYGSASAVTSLAGSALSALGYNAGTTATGSDVAGYFVLNGTTIAATGNGQVLRAAAGAPADELVVRHTGSSAPPQGTPAATLNLSEGYAVTMERVASRLLAENGGLGSRTDGLSRSIQEIAAQRTRLNSRLADTEVRIRTQFSALDTLISRLSSTSNFLNQQLARMPGSSTSGN
jgi:flagellar hook-associated protein 2